MWNINPKGEKEFTGNKNNWKEAAKIAEKCEHFKIDEEDEQVSDEPVSCYNCRYRRWSLKSFTCSKAERSL